MKRLGGQGVEKEIIIGEIQRMGRGSSSKIVWEKTYSRGGLIRSPTVIKSAGMFRTVRRRGGGRLGRQRLTNAERGGKRRKYGGGFLKLADIRFLFEASVICTYKQV